jgi:hypothetical protein
MTNHRILRHEAADRSSDEESRYQTKQNMLPGVFLQHQQSFNDGSTNPRASEWNRVRGNEEAYHPQEPRRVFPSQKLPRPAFFPHLLHWHPAPSQAICLILKSLSSTLSMH